MQMNRLQVMKHRPLEIVKNFDLVLDSEEAILFVLGYVERNKLILNCAYDSIGRDELKRFFYNDFNGIIMNLIESVEKMEHIKADEDYKRFLCELYTTIHNLRQHRTTQRSGSHPGDSCKVHRSSYYFLSNTVLSEKTALKSSIIGAYKYSCKNH